MPGPGLAAAILMETLADRLDTALIEAQTDGKRMLKLGWETPVPSVVLSQGEVSDIAQALRDTARPLLYGGPDR